MVFTKWRCAISHKNSARMPAWDIPWEIDRLSTTAHKGRRPIPIFLWSETPEVTIYWKWPNLIEKLEMAIAEISCNSMSVASACVVWITEKLGTQTVARKCFYIKSILRIFWLVSLGNTKMNNFPPLISPGKWRIGYNFSQENAEFFGQLERKSYPLETKRQTTTKFSDNAVFEY